MRHDEGFKLFVGALSREYLDATMSASTFDNILATFYDRVKKNVLNDLRSLCGGCLAVGYSGPFLDAELDLTTAAYDEHITFTVPYVPSPCRTCVRVAAMLSGSRWRHEHFPARTLLMTSRAGLKW